MSKKTRATGTGGHNCSVVDCQNPDRNIFTIPSGDADLKNSWMQFIFNNKVPVAPAAKLFVCARHFSSDSFSNLGQYNVGLAKNLRLEKGVVPNIRDRTTAQQKVSGNTKLLPCLCMQLKRYASLDSGNFFYRYNVAITICIPCC